MHFLLENGGKLGSFGDVLLVISQWSTSATDLTITISVDLVLKR